MDNQHVNMNTNPGSLVTSGQIVPSSPASSNSNFLDQSSSHANLSESNSSISLYPASSNLSANPSNTSQVLSSHQSSLTADESVADRPTSTATIPANIQINNTLPRALHQTVPLQTGLASDTLSINDSSTSIKTETLKKESNEPKAPTTPGANPPAPTAPLTTTAAIMAQMPSTVKPPISELMSQLEEYSPTIPDSVISYYLNKVGYEVSDPRIVRLIALASQKFVSDIATDALHYHKMRGNNSAPVKKHGKQQEKKTVLQIDDLNLALNDYGITVTKPPYFT